jgi:hypothetical protein
MEIERNLLNSEMAETEKQLNEINDKNVKLAD